MTTTATTINDQQPPIYTQINGAIISISCMHRWFSACTVCGHRVVYKIYDYKWPQCAVNVQRSKLCYWFSVSVETAVPVRAFLLFNRFAIRASFVHISPVDRKNKVQLSRMKNMTREAKGMKKIKKQCSKAAGLCHRLAVDVMTIH